MGGMRLRQMNLTVLQIYDITSLKCMGIKRSDQSNFGKVFYLDT